MGLSTKSVVWAPLLIRALLGFLHRPLGINGDSIAGVTGYDLRESGSPQALLNIQAVCCGTLKFSVGWLCDVPVHLIDVRDVEAANEVSPEFLAPASPDGSIALTNLPGLFVAARATLQPGRPDGV